MKANETKSRSAKCPCYQKHSGCRIFCHCDPDERFVTSIWLPEADDVKQHMHCFCCSISGYQRCRLYRASMLELKEAGRPEVRLPQRTAAYQRC